MKLQIDHKPLRSKLNAYLDTGITTPEQEAWAEKVYREGVEAYIKRGLKVRKGPPKPREHLWATDKLYCPRQVVLTMRGKAVDDWEPHGRMKAKTGTMLGYEVAALLILAGVKVLAVEERMDRHLPSGLRQTGYKDVVVDGVEWGPQYAGMRIPVEVKSTDPFSFKAVKTKGVENKFGYLFQGASYAKDSGAPFMVFLYLDRSQCYYEEFRVNNVDEIHEELERQADIVAADMATGGLPEMPDCATTVKRPRLKMS